MPSFMLGLMKGLGGQGLERPELPVSHPNSECGDGKGSLSFKLSLRTNHQQVIVVG